MDLEISWTANWLGNHDICYREQGTLAYTCTTIYANLGPNSTIIQVPDNFCGQVVYEGYVLAQCQGGGALPAEGTEFTIIINEKVDPCMPYNIHCDNAPIALLSLIAPGSGYLDGEVVTADGIPVGTVGILPGGELGSVVLTNNTTTFSALPVMAINTTGGLGGVIGVQLADCAPILNGCDGSNDQGVPAIGVQAKIPVGSDFYLCATTVPAPLPAAQMTVSPLLNPPFETCHCENCIEARVSNPTPAPLSIWYMTYDPGMGAIVLYKEVIVAGASNQPLSNQAIADSITAQVGLVVNVQSCPAFG